MSYKQGHPYQDRVEDTSEKREQTGIKMTPITAGRTSVTHAPQKEACFPSNPVSP